MRTEGVPLHAEQAHKLLVKDFSADFSGSVCMTFDVFFATQAQQSEAKGAILLIPDVRQEQLVMDCSQATQNTRLLPAVVTNDPSVHACDPSSRSNADSRMPREGNGLAGGGKHQ